VGLSGSGTFTQSAGSNTIASNLYLGYNPAAAEAIAWAGGCRRPINTSAIPQRRFTQSGGSNTAANNLYLGYNAGGSGSYSLGAADSCRLRPNTSLLRDRQLQPIGRNQCLVQLSRSGYNSRQRDLSAQRERPPVVLPPNISAIPHGQFHAVWGTDAISGSSTWAGGRGAREPTISTADSAAFRLDFGSGSTTFPIERGTLRAGAVSRQTGNLTPCQRSVTVDTAGCTLTLGGLLLVRAA